MKVQWGRHLKCHSEGQRAQEEKRRTNWRERGRGKEEERERVSEVTSKVYFDRNEQMDLSK